MTQAVKDLVEDAEQAARAGDLILDVREPAELDAAGRIAGGLHLPHGILETRADATTDTAEARLTAISGSARVHVLCASGGRAALAADTLRRMEYDAALIEGGLGGWKSAGLPVDG